MFKFSQKSLDLLNNEKLDSRLRDLMNEIIKISKVRFEIIYSLRTAEEQNKIFKDGASQCDGFIKQSEHQKGLAIDIVCYVNDKITWDKKYYYYIAGLVEIKAIELKLNITWGGWWSFEDCGHFQIKN